MLLYLIVKYEKDYIVDYNVLRYAILCDAAKVLVALLQLLLKQQGIKNIESYHENRVVTFEFVFTLLKLCVNIHDDKVSKKCQEILRHWLQTISKYHSNSTTLACSHNNASLSQIKDNNNNPDDYVCILCLTPTKLIVCDKNELEHTYDYCGCCDYVICQNCTTVHNYQSKRV